ncbi:ABC transporter ATP-binding protein [Clostridium cylindrosporum]|uniref:ABC-type multidrug transport system, ATPase component n=1 Tax=Clostridium cylindrosporum DSM 605 TaxID=1121307 RepID=A0A0J8D642_CLOCY|nr:ABC transporter ATP-binding protein [Clostridium cylindrosporum]KMT21322.1 ABC-type multidrug transport system, ATPase component [Clostridium cylindrosporum DSM 605]
MIIIENLYKSYDKMVLKDINLNIKGNRIVGLIGKNGSGKTTLLKIISSIVKPSSGKITIFNKEIGYKSREIVSYMMDENILFKGMTVKEALEFYKMFFWDFNEGNAKGMLAEFQIDLSKKINTLSRGNLEKLNVALTFSRKAKVYLLDEPLAGVDPEDRVRVIDTILNNFEEGSIMIISTNLISEIEYILDDVIFLKSGEVAIYSSIDDLKGLGIQSIRELFMEESNEKSF